MRTSFFSVLALSALFSGAIAAPTAIPAESVAIEERSLVNVTSIIDTLFATVQKYTASISESTQPFFAPVQVADMPIKT